MRKIMVPLALLVFFGLCPLVCVADDALQVSSTADVATLSFQAIEGGTEGAKELLITALDGQDAPIRGLTADDIVIKLGRKKAKILTFETLETSEKVGLNIVMVLDNSYSMKQRKAIEPLLTAMEEFYKVIRPIDSIHMIVFDNDNTMKIGDRDLHVKILESNDISGLRTFLGEAFDDGLSVKTILYEAMVAGLDVIRKMPENSNKFLVVFTDGEDINSAFKSDVVEAEAKDIPNLEAYVVDYMPGDKPNPFLGAFAQTHGGRLWKATDATDLMPIFNSFSSRLLYRYVATYRFLDPPEGAIGMKPAELDLQVFTMLDGSPMKSSIFFQAGKSDITPPYVLMGDREQAGAFDASSLETAMDRYFNILNIIGRAMVRDPALAIAVKGFNDGQGVEQENLELSESRAGAVKSYLQEIWGVDASRMRTEAGNLPENGAAPDVLGGNAENRRVEISFDSPDMEARMAGVFVDEVSHVGEIRVEPRVKAEYGLADWEISLLGDGEQITAVTGAGDPESSYQFSLDSLGKQKLANVKQIQARIKVADTNGDAYETDAALCDVRVSKREIIHGILRPPSGELAVSPDAFNIEEVTTIDSSPLLNFVYFELDQGSIPDQYTVFKDQGEARAFSESALRGSMEKYLNVLNILAKRLADNPGASIEIIGCNSNYGPEKNRKDLSRLRAEAVASYLKYIWGVDGARMTVKARNLPAAASTSKTEEGRAENQRVEIHSASPEVLDVIESTYVEAISNAREIVLTPDIQAGYDLKSWKIELLGDGSLVKSLDGEGALAPEYTIGLENEDLIGFGAYENLSAQIQVEDAKGEQFKARTAGIPVEYIRKEQQLAQKDGYKVLEKYALILFDFNSAKIKERNQAIVDRITERIRKFPAVTVKITGHTDNIGKEEYNVKLSKKRAKAVYDQLAATIGKTEGMDISYKGVGPENPLFDNIQPHGRALNRTVTVTLEYEMKE